MHTKRYKNGIKLTINVLSYKLNKAVTQLTFMPTREKKYLSSFFLTPHREYLKVSYFLVSSSIKNILQPT
jgi:hypothetical protein